MTVGASCPLDTLESINPTPACAEHLPVSPSILLCGQCLAEIDIMEARCTQSHRAKRPGTTDDMASSVCRGIRAQSDTQAPCPVMQMQCVRRVQETERETLDRMLDAHTAACAEQRANTEEYEKKIAEQVRPHAGVLELVRYRVVLA